MSKDDDKLIKTPFEKVMFRFEKQFEVEVEAVKTELPGQPVTPLLQQTMQFRAILRLLAEFQTEIDKLKGPRLIQ